MLKKDDLLQQLSELGFRPSKKLGQNFLIDPQLAQSIIRKLNITPHDHILEIGCGMGALTDNVITSSAKKVTLIEIDYRLSRLLRIKYQADIQMGRVSLLEQDSLKVNPTSLFGFGPVKMVSNLPYKVAIDLIFHFCSSLSPVFYSIVMVQKEIAERLMSNEGNKSYGSISIKLQSCWKIKKIRSVPPQVFWPVPKVNSTIIELTKIPPEQRKYFKKNKLYDLVNFAFAQRRKKLIPRLKLDQKILEKWLSYGYSIDLRPENLSVKDWILLTRIIDNTDEVSKLEIFDIVDENDAVIDKQLRDFVHTNNLRHRAIHIWIFNPQGEIYLQKRSPWKEKQPNLWCSSVSGHVCSGESYLSAAMREMREEISIQTELREYFAISAQKKTCFEFIKFYVGYTDQIPCINDYEISAGGFFSIDHLIRWFNNYPQDFTPIFSLLAENFLKQRQNYSFIIK